MASWIALAPLILMLSWPRPGRLGWVHGFASWLVGLYWIVPTLQTYGGTTPVPVNSTAPWGKVWLRNSHSPNSPNKRFIRAIEVSP